MDTQLNDGERYRLEEDETGIVALFEVGEGKLYLMRAEDTAGNVVNLDEPRIESLIANALAKIKSDKLWPLKEDER